MNSGDHLKINNIVETKLTVISIRKDGIVEIRFKSDDCEVDAEERQNIEQALIKLSNNNNKSFHIITLAGKYNIMTKEAREMQFDDSNRYRMRKSVAVVLTSLSQRLLAKSFYSLKKVDYPVNFFETEKEATIWTEKLMKST